MKKVILIAIVLFGVATAQAQTQAVTDSTKNKKWELAIKGQWYLVTPPKLPQTLTQDMVIEQINRGLPNAVLTITFKKELTENEIELVKEYVLYHYDWAQTNRDNKVNSYAPDIDNTKKKCVMKFYKL
jgi:hypothetical protein